MYAFSDITTLHALKMYDKFLTMNKGLVNAQMQSLIGIVCLCLSVKMHESVVLDFKQASELC